MCFIVQTLKRQLKMVASTTDRLARWALEWNTLADHLQNFMNIASKLLAAKRITEKNYGLAIASPYWAYIQ
jgi:hypothetical protein